MCPGSTVRLAINNRIVLESRMWISDCLTSFDFYRPSFNGFSCTFSPRPPLASLYFICKHRLFANKISLRYRGAWRGASVWYLFFLSFRRYFIFDQTVLSRGNSDFNLSVCGLTRIYVSKLYIFFSTFFYGETSSRARLKCNR